MRCLIDCRSCSPGGSALPSFLTLVLLANIVALSPGALAQEPSSNWDATWEHAKLYQGEGLVRTLALSGRLHADAAYFDADQGDWNDVLWRRFRFGFKAELANNWVAHVEAALNLDDLDDDFYSRLTDAYIAWTSNKGLQLKALKHSAGFTLDGATSSKKLLSPQRNNLTRNLWFTAEYFSGLSLSSTGGAGWQYKLGVFSGDADEEISNFSAGYFGLVSLGYDWSEQWDFEAASLRLDYVDNDDHVDNNTPDLSRVVSLSSTWQAGPWGLRTDLAAGEGQFGQSDLWGLVLMPHYQLTPQLQLVARYTLLDSDRENGLRLGRYEDRIVMGRGDSYNEYFAGVNYFFYGHKFKWQTGLQYTDMDDSAGDGGEYNGWGITTVLRVYW